MDFLNSIYDKRDKPISDSSKKLYNRNLKKFVDLFICYEIF